MSKNRRRIELIPCSCTETCVINEFCLIVMTPENTVHIENKDGYMRCLICGNLKEEDYQKKMWNI